MQEDTLNYPPSLKKLGLERDEFEKVLKSKMIKLFDDDEDSLEEHKINKSIECAKKCFGIRPKSGNPDESDQRNFANKVMKKEGNLKDEKKTPQKLKRESSGRGNTQYTKAENRKYHRKQFHLFTALNEQGKLEDDSFDENGFLLKPDEDPCSIVEMCNKLDAVTKEFIEELKENARIPETAIAEDKRNSIKKLFDLCKSVVSGRVCVDWAVENDIMKKREYQNWQEHVWAIMTFAALLVVIDALSKSSRYKRKSLLRIWLDSLRSRETARNKGRSS